MIMFRFVRAEKGKIVVVNDLDYIVKEEYLSRIKKYNKPPELSIKTIFYKIEKRISGDSNLPQEKAKEINYFDQLLKRD